MTAEQRSRIMASFAAYVTATEKLISAKRRHYAIGEELTRCRSALAEIHSAG